MPFLIVIVGHTLGQISIGASSSERHRPFTTVDFLLQMQNWYKEVEESRIERSHTHCAGSFTDISKSTGCFLLVKFNFSLVKFCWIGLVREACLPTYILAKTRSQLTD
jgi:hypothetical protein